MLSRKLERKVACLGVYGLVAGRTAHGRAVWRHERGNRWIAKNPSGAWVVQKEEDVGVNDAGFLRLHTVHWYGHASGAQS